MAKGARGQCPGGLVQDGTGVQVFLLSVFALATLLFHKSYNCFFGCLWFHLYSLWVSTLICSSWSPPVSPLPFPCSSFLILWLPFLLENESLQWLYGRTVSSCSNPPNCFFLAFPHLKINSIRSHLPSLCQSPAAIPPAHLLPQMLSLSPPPSSALHAVPLWMSVGPAPHSSLQAHHAHHLPPLHTF